MTLHPLLAQLLTPNRYAVIFAIKGVVAMSLALFVSMALQLDRPYWAMVAAIFLQIRPESGLVIEKALCLIVGSAVGAGFGILVLAFLTPYPLLALGLLALWIGLNSAFSSLVHNLNYIYAFAMAGMTAGLVVILVMADASTTNSQAVFVIAQARISEIAAGAVCAMLVSQLLWPITVRAGLRENARNVINKTLAYLTLELEPGSSHEQRHQHADEILEILVALNDDSSAATYEGPEGSGRARAANLLCNKVMSLLAVAQIMGRFQRNHAELVSPALSEVLSQMRHYFREIAEADSYQESYRRAHELRRSLLEQRSGFTNESAIVTRLTKTALELVSDLVVVLRAYNALESRDRTLLKAPMLETHRDPLVGLINGFRTAMMFVIGAAIWIETASSSALMIMIMPVVFSVMFARFSLAELTPILRRVLMGATVAIVVALTFGLGLLSRASGNVELLILVLAGPFFFGLLALANRPTLPYGLGFCVSFTIIMQPSNSMTFDAENAVNIALGLFVGISILYWVFKVITPPGSRFMQRRMVRSTARDLAAIDDHASPENWFNGRMGERLLRLANYDQSSGSPDRYMTDLGFTGLNLGHMSIRLRKLIQDHRSPAVDALLQEWQQTLADTYLLSARGAVTPAFRKVSARLLKAIHAQKGPDQKTMTIEGMFERLALTFERTASTVAEATGQPPLFSAVAEPLV